MQRLLDLERVARRPVPPAHPTRTPCRRPRRPAEGSSASGESVSRRAAINACTVSGISLHHLGCTCPRWSASNRDELLRVRAGFRPRARAVVRSVSTVRTVCSRSDGDEARGLLPGQRSEVDRALAFLSLAPRRSDAARTAPGGPCRGRATAPPRTSLRGGRGTSSSASSAQWRSSNTSTACSALCDGLDEAAPGRERLLPRGRAVGRRSRGAASRLALSHAASANVGRELGRASRAAASVESDSRMPVSRLHDLAERPERDAVSVRAGSGLGASARARRCRRRARKALRQGCSCPRRFAHDRHELDRRALSRSALEFGADQATSRARALREVRRAARVASTPKRASGTRADGRARIGADLPLRLRPARARRSRRHAPSLSYVSIVRDRRSPELRPCRRAAVLTTSPATMPSPSSGTCAQSDHRLARCRRRSAPAAESAGSCSFSVLDRSRGSRSPARTARSASSSCATVHRRRPSRVADELLHRALVLARSPCRSAGGTDDPARTSSDPLARRRREADEIAEEHVTTLRSSCAEAAATRSEAGREEGKGYTLVSSCRSRDISGRRGAVLGGASWAQPGQRRRHRAPAPAGRPRRAIATSQAAIPFDLNTTMSASACRPGSSPATIECSSWTSSQSSCPRRPARSGRRTRAARRSSESQQTKVARSITGCRARAHAGRCADRADERALGEPLAPQHGVPRGGHGDHDVAAAGLVGLSAASAATRSRTQRPLLVRLETTTRSIDGTAARMRRAATLPASLRRSGRGWPRPPSPGASRRRRSRRPCAPARAGRPRSRP